MKLTSFRRFRREALGFELISLSVLQSTAEANQSERGPSLTASGCNSPLHLLAHRHHAEHDVSTKLLIPRHPHQ